MGGYLDRSIILLLVFLMTFDSSIIRGEEEKIFYRHPRMIFEADSPVLEAAKLSELLEFDAGPRKCRVVREDVDDTVTTRISTPEVSPFVRFDPVDKDKEEEEEEETVDEESIGDSTEDNETPEVTSHKSKHAKFLHKLRHKLTDKNTKFTVSLPIAIVIVTSTILISCCCALYLRNRLVACINFVTGKNKKKSKMLTVDLERGGIIPRSRKKSISKPSSKKINRARSLSMDFVHMGTQKSSGATAATQHEEVDDEPTTGCYRCCKKKKKRPKKK